MKNGFDVIVIGAGASGLMASIFAARSGAHVTVLEQMPKGGRKLLVTGNGRCNLSSLDPKLPARYHSHEPAALKEMTESVFGAFSVQDTLDFFREEGLLLHFRQDYVYPSSDQASAVLDTLLDAALSAGVRFRYQTKVTGIQKQAGSGAVKVLVEGWEYAADRVILSAGSKAWVDKEYLPGGYGIAGAAGHRIFPVLPALTALCTGDPYTAMAAGARTDALMTLRIKKKGEEREMSHSERGELQITRDALSGIAVFQLSRFASIALERKEDVRLEIDFLPDLDPEEITSFLKKQIHRAAVRGDGRDVSAESVLSRMMNSRIAGMLTAMCGMKKTPAGAVTKEQLSALVRRIKKCSFAIAKVRDYSQAQTCCGGVSLSEIDPRTLESRLFPGLFFSGEILDIDGPCGGYNLQWAWSSGMAAGTAAGQGSPRNNP